MKTSVSVMCAALLSSGLTVMIMLAVLDRAPVGPPNVPPGEPATNDDCEVAQLREKLARALKENGVLRARMEEPRPDAPPSTDEDDPARDSMDASRRWVDAVMKARNDAERQVPLAEMMNALSGDDRSLACAALKALNELRTVKLSDSIRQRFRRLVLPFTGDGSPEIRVAAYRSLSVLFPVPEHVEVYRKAAQDEEPGVRKLAGGLMLRATPGKHADDVLDSVAELVKDPDESVRVATLYALSTGRVRVSPGSELEQDLVGLIEDSSNPTIRHASSAAVCAIPEKTTAIVQALLKAIRNPDSRIRTDAWRALRQGIRKEDQPILVRELLSVLEQTEDARDIQRGAGLVSEYGKVSDLPALEGIAARFDPDSPAHRSVMSAIRGIRGQAAPDDR